MVISISENPKFLPATATVEGKAATIHEAVQLFKSACLAIGYAQETVNAIRVDGEPAEDLDMAGADEEEK